jgi:hypothetical protein
MNEMEISKKFPPVPTTVNRRNICHVVFSLAFVRPYFCGLVAHSTPMVFSRDQLQVECRTFFQTNKKREILIRSTKTTSKAQLDDINITNKQNPPETVKVKRDRK